MRMADFFISICFVGGVLRLRQKTDRKIEYVETADGVTQQQIFEKALTYLTKQVNDSNAAIKMKNSGTAQIIMQGNLSCNEMRQAGDINDYRLSFILDFKGERWAV